MSWDTLDIKEREIFSQFKRKYGKFIHLGRDEWNAIDEQRIVRDFKVELKKKGQDYYFEGIEDYKSFDFPLVVVNGYNKIEACSISWLSTEPKERCTLLFSISHSLYYGSRRKTKIPAKPGHRDIVHEILQEKRFHIFIGEESEDNVIIDAILHSIKVNQPQLAIAPVFGYQRHKNNLTHESLQETKTYFYCLL